MQASQATAVPKSTSQKSKSKKTRVSESQSRVNEYLAEEDNFYQKFPTSFKEEDRRKAHEDRARKAVRDADRSFPPVKS
ncbi:uncharacterized protein CTRU02_206162 [Colletotrichum truncatum]|uniref:Uncharacterized protein n=1 Tax=Colletotrichum truncatum TaxID=5467 RepID=A0ACC3Z667_COLTU|nr:uncharacterized protein CTRU02_10420 [Colletotrichum truncatum]KAF6787157.1 hypothetical protein CTRU02_10420 [Colletotrichum truncatum]